MRGLDAGADYYLVKSNFQDVAMIEAVVDLIGDRNHDQGKLDMTGGECLGTAARS